MNGITFVVVYLVLCFCLLVWLFARKSSAKVARTADSRRKRIKTFSKIISGFIWVSLLIGAYCYLAFVFGWAAPFVPHVKIIISPQHIYTTAAEMPDDIFWFMMVRVGLMFFGAGVLLWLFRLYGRGILFSAQNVTCIRCLGYVVILDWFTNYELQGLLHDLTLSTTSLFVGLLIIFIAWIMDEGRKIQEEQELTV